MQVNTWQKQQLEKLRRKADQIRGQAVRRRVSEYAEAPKLTLRTDVCFGQPRESLNTGHLEAVLAARRMEDETVR